MIFVAGYCFCQKNTIATSPYPSLQFYKQAALQKPVKNSKPSLPANVYLFSSFYLPQQIIAPNYYSSNLGFFCKKEIQFQKITSIPFKFRLGSVQQCDWLEGK
jgi:hypothetical protein